MMLCIALLMQTAANGHEFPSGVHRALLELQVQYATHIVFKSTTSPSLMERIVYFESVMDSSCIVCRASLLH